MATINSKIEGVDVLGVVTAGETIYVGRATSTQHGVVKPAATDFLFDSQTNALLVKLGVGLKRTADGIAIAIYAGNVVTDVIAIAEGLEIKYADIDEETENSKVIPWSEFTAAEIEYLKKYFNIEPGTGEGAVQQIGAEANGKQSAAFGGLRYDKQTGRTPTSADGNQSFAAGGSVHAEGDFSAAFGKDVNAYQKGSFAAGGGCEAGLTEEEFNAFYWDPSTNTALHHGKGKDANGNILNDVGETYEKSYSLGAAFGETNKTLGRGGLTAGSANENKSQNGFTTGLENVTDGWFNNAFGQKNRTMARNSIVAGYKNAIGYENTESNTPENWTELPYESVRDSSAFGVRNTNKHIRTHTIGSGLVTSARDQVIVGTGNTENSNAAFQVGTGTYDQTTETVTKRETAFEVLKDGRAKLQAGPKDDDDIVRKADLGYEIDFPHGEPTVRCDNTDGITVTGTMRIYLNQAKTVFHDVPNVSVEIPIFAGQNVTIDADETNKKAVVKVSDIDVNTLISLLLSSNGIKITENEAGDRLLIGISRLGFELGTFEANGDGIKFAYNNDIAEQIYLGASLGGAIDIYNSLVSIDNYIRVKATANEYIEINNEDVIYHTASRVKHYLREDTVKTIGGQSIYGSGDIPISGETIDADTLSNLLAGSNGIGIAKNAAGDKVNIKGAIPITVQFTQLTETIGQYTVTLSPDVDIATGPYANWKFVCDYIGSYYDFIGFHLNGASEATSKLLYAEGPSNNVKTLFGNQSIYGTGNIDLYRHNVKLTAVSGSQTICDCVFTVISSSNTAIDSLTDLFSVLKPIVGSDSTYPVNGCMYYTSNNKYYVATRVYPTSDGGIIANTPDEERWFKWPELATLTFYDSITTV